jgi:hypothetical protein
MKTTLISKDNNEAKIKMEFTAEEFDAATDKVFRKNRKDFQIPGFRKARRREASSRSTTAKGCSSRTPSTSFSESITHRHSRTMTWTLSTILK